MKKPTKRKAVPAPPLSPREVARELARLAVRRTLARDASLRKLVRRMKAEMNRRDRDIEALTRQLMDYCGIVEAAAPGPPSIEEEP